MLKASYYIFLTLVEGGGGAVVWSLLRLSSGWLSCHQFIFVKAQGVLNTIHPNTSSQSPPSSSPSSSSSSSQSIFPPPTSPPPTLHRASRQHAPTRTTNKVVPCSAIVFSPPPPPHRASWRYALMWMANKEKSCGAIVFDGGIVVRLAIDTGTTVVVRSTHEQRWLGGIRFYLLFPTRGPYYYTNWSTHFWQN